MVTRDPEFDDNDRASQLALLEYERGICDCGVHESLAQDEDNVWTFELRKCPVCKGSAQYGRVQAAEDRAIEEQLKDSPPATPRPSDGRRTMIRQLSPMEVEARRGGPRREQPEPPA